MDLENKFKNQVSSARKGNKNLSKSSKLDNIELFFWWTRKCFKVIYWLCRINEWNKKVAQNKEKQ